MRPSHAESTRTLIASSDRGVLSTHMTDDGHPYGSLVEAVSMDDGDVVFFLSTMADHTQNLLDNARCSFVTSEDFAADHPLEGERATLLGDAEQVEHTDALRRAYLQAHPHAELYIDFDDFDFYRLRPERIRYVGGFGRMSWIDGEDYREADPDPLLEMAAGIRDHMNEDHVDAMVAMAEVFGDVDGTVEDARMFRVDAYGFDLEVATDEGRRRARIGYPEDRVPVTPSDDIRALFTQLTQRARDES
jgi:putative heme iron utilization protein